MSDKRRKNTSEFWAEAVKSLTGTGPPVAHLAAEIGVGAGRCGNKNADLRLEHGGGLP